jgi:hypothetical protein
MHRSKKILAYARARREIPAVSAAEALFGSTVCRRNRSESVFCASQVAQTASARFYYRSSQKQTIMAHTYTEAVTVNPCIASKRWLRLRANIKSSNRHAKALL